MASMKALAAIALMMVVVCPIALGYALAIDEDEAVGWETTDQYNVSDLLLNHNTPYYMAYTSPNNNSHFYPYFAVYNSIGDTVTSTPEVRWDYTIFGTEDLTTPVRITEPNCIVSMPANASRLDLTLKDGNHYIYTPTTSSSALSFATLYISPGVVRILDETTGETTTVTNVSIIEVYRTVTRPADFSISWPVSTGKYYDVSAGWYVEVPNIWMNDQVNNSVTLLMDVPVGGTGTLSLERNDPALPDPDRFYIKNVGGTLSVGDGSQWIPLGPYAAAQVTVTESEYHIKGLASWPAYGSNPATFNEIVLSHGTWDNRSLAVWPGATYRVDSSEIFAGSYPSTLDYSLDLNALFPGDLMAVSLNSIGIYGDSLSIGDDTYQVTNGKIAVDGKQVALKGALISFIPDETGQLIGTIGGREVGSFATAPSITFGGEWSLTAIAYKVEETTTTNMSWHAGEFGLDKAGFVAAGLIFAGIAFVVLGMHGRASGSKVGLLMLICGGAAAAYIIIL